jgi:hypothetical protein
MEAENVTESGGVLLLVMASVFLFEPNGIAVLTSLDL